MDKKERITPPAIGASSLLVIFSVLCLTVFALLSLSTVQAQRRMADASVKAVSAYYSAECQAEEVFAALRSGRMVSGVSKTGDYYEYACSISENQKLMVELVCRNGEWEVLRWQTVATVQISQEDRPDVWDGVTY